MTNPESPHRMSTEPEASGVPPRRLPRALFPALVLGPPVATALLTSWGGDPPLVLTVVVLALIVTVVGLEQRVPFRAAWARPSRGETRTDLVYVLLASVPDRLTRVAVEALFLGFLASSGVASRGGDGKGALVREVLGALAAFVVADLGKYLVHRASHERPWLWKLHLAHHQPKRLSATNALRLHPLNMAYNAAIDTVPLLLFGVGPKVAAVMATLRAAVAVVQHANLDLESGRQLVLNAPSYHRTHHAVDPAEGNHNYGSTLLVWDHLFGTLAHRAAPAEVGVVEPEHPLPNGYLGQLFYPLCGARLRTTCVLGRLPFVTR